MIGNTIGYDIGGVFSDAIYAVPAGNLVIWSDVTDGLLSSAEEADAAETAFLLQWAR